MRPPAALGPAAIVRVAAEIGFDGIGIEADCTLADVHVLAAEGLRAGVPVQIVAGPLPEAALRPDRRLPVLACVDDKEEALAAVKLVERMFEAGTMLGVKLYAIDLGPVALAARADDVRRFFARRELDDGDPGYVPFRRAVDERKGRSGGILDACRGALERVLRAADRTGATIVLPIAGNPWGAPSPREALILLHEFRGAPIGAFCSGARRAVLETLGLAGPPERWAELEKAARLIHATDAAALDADLLPGLGEADVRPLPDGVPGLLSGRADSMVAEIRRAREFFRQAAPSNQSAASLSRPGCCRPAATARIPI